MTLWTLLSTLLAMSAPSSNAVATDVTMNGPRRGGPPPAAFEACAKLSEGDACTVETPRGTLTGTCRQPPKLDKLVCVPAGHRKGGGGGGGGNASDEGTAR